MSKQNSFQLYRGGPDRVPEQGIIDWLAQPPPWRKLAAVEVVKRNQAPGYNETEQRRGATYVSSGVDEILRVNISLALRRPLLVSGQPGLGKSTLAYNIAWTLGLGAPLRWEVNSQTTLKDGLYSYDAVGHLQATQTGNKKEAKEVALGEFITLGPLGTALLPTERPRVLLIDELDKATFDLSNDLLHVFEEGSFPIPELVRFDRDTHIYPFDASDKADVALVKKGRVQAHHHPVVVITTNREREFPEAFRRRCVFLDLKPLDEEQLRKIVSNQLGDEALARAATALDRYRTQATDVLLQALFLEGTGMDASSIFEVLKR